MNGLPVGSDSAEICKRGKREGEQGGGWMSSKGETHGARD